MIVTRYVIKDVQKELYWKGEEDVSAKFTMYIHQCKRFVEKQQAYDEVAMKLPNGIYQVLPITRKS